MSDRYKGAILSPTAPTVIPQSAGGVYTLSQQTQYQGQGVWPTAFNNPINNSLRFRNSASAYLSRTFGTATNSKICTYSLWVKRGKLSVSSPRLMDVRNGGTSKGSQSNYYFNGSDQLEFGDYNNVILTTSAVYRDPSAWYHIVLAIDTTQATATNATTIRRVSFKSHMSCFT